MPKGPWKRVIYTERQVVIDACERRSLTQGVRAYSEAVAQIDRCDVIVYYRHEQRLRMAWE